jgi:hypothetical protein
MTTSTATRANRCANLVFHRFDLGRVKGSSRQSEIGQLDMSRRIDQEVLSQRPPSYEPQVSSAFVRAMPSHPTDLWFQISVDVPELVKLAYAHEHFGGIEPSVFLLEHSRIVQQRPEVSTRDVFLPINILTWSAS